MGLEICRRLGGLRVVISKFVNVLKKNYNLMTVYLSYYFINPKLNFLSLQYFKFS